MSGEATVWVSTSSHRSRDKLKRLTGDPGPSYGIWPHNDGWPRGCYYRVPERFAEELRKIKGLRVLQGPPRGGKLFERWTTQ